MSTIIRTELFVTSGSLTPVKYKYNFVNARLWARARPCLNKRLSLTARFPHGFDDLVFDHENHGANDDGR